MYSEQAEATEFPVPGVGSRGLFKKSPGEGRPNQSLRCGLSAVRPCVCVWEEVRGLSLGRGQHGFTEVSPHQEHQPAPPDPAGLQPLRHRN